LPARLETLLKERDFLSLHCPLTELTHHLISEEALALTKPGVIIVNTARGPVIDLVALQAALAQAMWPAPASTFSTRALPIGHPLRAHPRVVATPHVPTCPIVRSWNCGPRRPKMRLRYCGASPLSTP